MKKEEASILLEDVIDTLIEVGNGIKEEHLHEACDKLFKFRDEYFKFIKEDEEKKDKILYESLPYKPTKTPLRKVKNIIG